MEIESIFMEVFGGLNSSDAFSIRSTNRVADGAVGLVHPRPRCQPRVPSVICRKGLAASRC
jgi:hypothetical protein